MLNVSTKSPFANGEFLDPRAPGRLDDFPDARIVGVLQQLPGSNQGRCGGCRGLCGFGLLFQLEAPPVFRPARPEGAPAI